MKSRFAFVLAAVTAIALIAPIGARAAPGTSGEHTVTYHVSLGDSLAAGTQPGVSFTDQGYSDQLYTALRAEEPKLEHIKLGCPAETTETMITGELARSGRGAYNECSYPHGSQLAEAVSFLRAHQQFVTLVTIDIGGNDLIGEEGSLVCDIADVDCFLDKVAEIQANLPVILSTLREAAGPDVPIVGMNYYNPFLAGWFIDPALAIQSNFLLTQLVNPTLEGIYGAYASGYADVETAFMTTDFTPGPGGVPVNVATICAWTWMCAVGNFHPNPEGYGVIKEAFEAVLL